MKNNMLKNSSGTKAAATKKADCTIADRRTHLTSAEQTHAAKVIIGLSEIYVGFSDYEEKPYFDIGSAKRACMCNGAVGASDMLTLPLPKNNIIVATVANVLEYIRAGSPTPQVGEVLVDWFDEFYLPRIKRLPSIYRRLQSETKVWRWITTEAKRVGTTANDWVRTQALGQRDLIKDVITGWIDSIKSAISDELFDSDEVADLPNEFDAVIKPVDDKPTLGDPEISGDYLIKVGEVLRENQRVIAALNANTDTPF